MSQAPITFVTTNPNKLEEVLAILGPDFPRQIIAHKAKLPELQGDEMDICREKCKDAIRLLHRPVIIEDTCLCFNALHGLPGPYIKWFLEKLGPEGLYKMLSNWSDKTADAVCTFAYSSGDEDKIVYFQGRLSGKIVPPRGPENFGWDPCFEPDGYDKTFAELPQETKNQISHRYKALEKMRDYFISNAENIE